MTVSVAGLGHALFSSKSDIRSVLCFFSFCIVLLVLGRFCPAFSSLVLIVLSQHILPIPPSLPFVLISQSCPFATTSAVLTAWMMALIMSHTLFLLKIRHYSILVLALQSLFAPRNMSFTVLLYSLSPPCYHPPSQANAPTVQYHPSSPIRGTLVLSGNGGEVASLRHGIKMLWRGRATKKVGRRVF